jgi:hypothetical protein
MIGGIPAGPFEDDACRGHHFAKAVLAAFRAAFKGFILKRLLALELNTTTLATVCISGHTLSLLRTARDYSPLQGDWQDQRKPALTLL